MLKKKYTELELFKLLEKEQKKIKEERENDLLKSTFSKGNFYIFRSNEWEDINIRCCIGYGYEKNIYVPFLEDIITKEAMLNYTEAFKPYSDGMLKTLCKLNPYEQYTIMNKSGIDIMNKKIPDDKKELKFKIYEEWNDFILRYEEEKNIYNLSL